MIDPAFWGWRTGKPALWGWQDVTTATPVATFLPSGQYFTLKSTSKSTWRVYTTG